MFIRSSILLSIVILMQSCLKTESSSGTYDQSQEISSNSLLDDESYEAISLFGKPLTRPELTGAALQKREYEFSLAKKDYDNFPDSLEFIIWYGRQLGYMSRFKDAIQVFSEGLTLFPDSYQLYRHRGHRYITLRKFDAAIVDLEKAAFHIREVPLEIEKDGIPNRLNKPLSSTQFNIWYHLGLAYYFKGNYDKAISAYKKCMEVSNNDDLLVATTDWLYMTYQKIGNQEAANDLLIPIKRNMNIIENDAYHKRLLMYKGLINPEKILGQSNGNDLLQLVTQGYGVGNYYLSKGNLLRARQVFQRILDTEYWAAFGYIAAEVEMVNMSISENIQ